MGLALACDCRGAVRVCVRAHRCACESIVCMCGWASMCDCDWSVPGGLAYKRVTEGVWGPGEHLGKCACGSHFNKLGF